MTLSPYILMRDDPLLGRCRHQFTDWGLGHLEAAALHVQQRNEYQDRCFPHWLVHCPVTECDAAPWEPDGEVEQAARQAVAELLPEVSHG